jgi:hypothetical protein
VKVGLSIWRMKENGSKLARELKNYYAEGKIEGRWEI